MNLSQTQATFGKQTIIVVYQSKNDSIMPHSYSSNMWKPAVV